LTSVLKVVSWIIIYERIGKAEGGRNPRWGGEAKATSWRRVGENL